MDMPEEINRRLIDHCSTLLLAVSETAVQNLKRENVAGKIYNTGDPLYPVFRIYFQKSLTLNLTKRLSLEKKQYIFLTLHREKNVDNLRNLKSILAGISSFKDLSVIFPVHPRTEKRLKELNYLSKMSNFLLSKPLSYQETLHLIARAKMVITDSGGLQKEAFWAKVPCLTIREHTAWLETVNLGVNLLTSPDKKRITEGIRYINDHYETIKKGFLNLPNPYGKRDTIQKIIELLKNYRPVAK
jgi:UDP-N-acetylglucosamine 2-epimerase